MYTSRPTVAVLFRAYTLLINSACDEAYLWLFVVIITLLKLPNVTRLYYFRYDVAYLYI